MTVSKELFLAILAMDSYNRGYASGVQIGGPNSLGSATIESNNLSERQEVRDAGFYAQTYTIGAGVTGIAPGTTVISYRGTDSFGNDPGASASDWRVSARPASPRQCLPTVSCS